MVRLQHQIEADSNTSLRTLRHRDFALSQTINATDPISRLLIWLQLRESQSAGQPASTLHLEGVTQFALFVIGIFLGTVTITGVLFANPHQPVNALVFLGLLVGLQLALLIVTLGAALIPLRSHPSQSPLAFLNPAYWAMHRCLRRFSRPQLFHALPELSRLLVLRWGQVFAMGFNVALVIGFWLALALSDRNFGWSSTFTITDGALHNLLQWLSLPWQWLGDSTQVTPEIISSTRFEGLQTDFSSVQMASMRAWWPYLFCALATYGLLPRVLLFSIFTALYRRQLRQALLHYPGASLILDRLQAPLVTTGSPNHDEETRVEPTASAFGNGGAAGPAWIVDWSGALKSSPSLDLRDLGLNVTELMGGGLDFESDQDTLRKIKKRTPKTVIIAVKAWEPPLGELADFVGGIDDRAQCHLLLISLPGKGLRPSERKDWQIFTQRLSKPVSFIRTDSEGSP